MFTRDPEITAAASHWSAAAQYWPLIGQVWSRDPDTGLGLAESGTRLQISLLEVILGLSGQPRTHMTGQGEGETPAFNLKNRQIFTSDGDSPGYLQPASS